MKRALIPAVILLWCVMAGAAGTIFQLGFTGTPGENTLPDGWKSLDFEKITKHTAYTIISDGEHMAVKAVSRAAASGLIRELEASAREYPFISWQWKVENLIEKSDPKTKSGDDYPARVYVTFKYDPGRVGFFERAKYGAYHLVHGKYPPHGAINYIWATSTPRETTVDNAYTGRTKMVVMQSGPENLGRWITERRNLYEDYKRLFKEEPPPISGVAVMTDTDNTGESAVAWYKDISLHRE